MKISMDNQYQTRDDLIEAPRTITHEFWVNVYESEIGAANYHKEEFADENAQNDRIGPAQKFTVTVEVLSDD